MLIRPMERDDLDWVREQRNRPECRKWFRQPNLITKEHQEEWFLTTDMISRYYGFQTGQVIKINRTNLYDTIVQNSISYRAVKEDISTL